MRKVIIAILFTVAACGDDLGPDVQLMPDAASDATAVDAPADAAACEATDDACCDLLPDAPAASACFASGFPAGTCGVAVCWKSDCTKTRVDFCNRPPDGGV